MCIREKLADSDPGDLIIFHGKTILWNLMDTVDDTITNAMEFEAVKGSGPFWCKYVFKEHRHEKQRFIEEGLDFMHKAAMIHAQSDRKSKPQFNHSQTVPVPIQHPQSPSLSVPLSSPKQQRGEPMINQQPDRNMNTISLPDPSTPKRKRKVSPNFKAPKKKKEYIPQAKSGAWSILVSMTKRMRGNSDGFDDKMLMSKGEIIEIAKPFCRSSFAQVCWLCYCWYFINIFTKFVYATFTYRHMERMDIQHGVVPNN